MGGSDKRQRTTQPDAIDVGSPSNRKKKGVQGEGDRSQGTKDVWGDSRSGGEPFWWGEAPESLNYFRGGLDRCFRLDVARSIDAPSRGPALDHGSARVSS